MEWDIENIEEIKEYINSELAKRRTMISIEREEFNVNERVIHKRLLRGGYKKVDNKYVLKDNVVQVPHKSITTVIQEPNRALKGNFEESDIKALKELVGLVEPLKDVIQVYNKNMTKEKYIDIEPIEVKIDRKKLSGNIKATAFRIDENILIAWKDFIEKYDGEYKVQDLVGQALLEFIEKYEK